MNTQDHPVDSTELAAENSEDTIGRPNWEEREMAEEDDDFFMPTAVISPMASTAAENATSANESTDHMDPSRFDLEEDVVVLPPSEDVISDHAEGQEEAEEAADVLIDAGEAASNLVEGAEPAEVDASEASEIDIREPGNDDWISASENTIRRWAEISDRYTGREAFKTALVLPVLSALGYNTFDPDQVEPLEDESGQHDGYLAKGPHGDIVVVLDDSEIADDHRDKVAMRTGRSKIAIGARIPNEDGEGTRWQSIIEVQVDAEPVVAGLKYVHRDAFSREAIINLAKQMHGQQEHILEAIRKVMATPGEGFLNDIRKMILAEGHPDPLLLNERVALLASRILSGPEEEASEEDDDKARQVTPAEQQAMEQIRQICAPEIAADRIVARPAQSYLAVLLDDNNRRTIARLHFSAASRKYIGVFEGKNETRHAISGAGDVQKFAEELRARAKQLDPDAFPKEPDAE